MGQLLQQPLRSPWGQRSGDGGLCGSRGPQSSEPSPISPPPEVVEEEVGWVEPGLGEPSHSATLGAQDWSLGPLITVCAEGPHTIGEGVQLCS